MPIAENRYVATVAIMSTVGRSWTLALSSIVADRSAPEIQKWKKRPSVQEPSQPHGGDGGLYRCPELDMACIERTTYLVNLACRAAGL